MTDFDFVSRLNSRSSIYPDGRVLDPTCCIVLQVAPEYVHRFETQVSLIVAANLLSRMTPNLAFDIPDVPIHCALPWKNKTLLQIVKDESCLNRPDRINEIRPARKDDYILNIGASGGNINVHGSGWYAFVGSSSSPLPQQDTLNPIGAAFAATMAVTLLFDIKPQPISYDYIFDAFKWKPANGKFYDYPYTSFPFLGSLWFIGLGSVGSCALYFLSLATRNFQPVLIDMDKVEIENMDRSAIFRAEHLGLYKVHAADIFLNSIGIEDSVKETCSFSEANIRQHRQPGEPDVFISAANEQNVRYSIEQGMPPIQVYATTGNEWQTTLLRHIPLVDACSCCIFPPEKHVTETVCGGGKVENKETGEKIDAALPFLSFMAGLMTAAEILKMPLPGYPFTSNKVTFWASPKKRSPRFVDQIFKKKNGCVCQSRHKDIHQSMIAGSKFDSLSKNDAYNKEENNIEVPKAVATNSVKELIG